MNAQGIPVFYGGFDPDTCVAEVRPPVGSHVVVGKFELLRPVRLLDFDALAEVYVPGSRFDPEHRERQGRGAFLEHLVREVSMPIMPGDEAFEYLPTQVVAEFLASRTPPLDGIVFRSTQTGRVGRNVVLFNHACAVQRSDLPDGTEVEVFIPLAHVDEAEDPLGFIAVWERVPPESVDESESRASTRSALFEAAASSAPHLDDPTREASSDPTSDQEPTLRLDEGSVAARKIRAVKYDDISSEVIRTRETKGNGVPF